MLTTLLPSEIYSHIFSFLDCKDLLTTKRVCQQFSSVVDIVYKRNQDYHSQIIKDFLTDHPKLQPLYVQTSSPKSIYVLLDSTKELTSFPSSYREFNIRYGHESASSFGRNFEVLENNQRFDEISSTIDQHVERLFQKHSNISLIVPGMKHTKGKNTKVPCIVVFVCAKGEIPVGEPPIERFINDIPTDVDEDSYSPCQLKKIPLGTLVEARSEERYFVLSCSHSSTQSTLRIYDNIKRDDGKLIGMDVSLTDYPNEHLHEPDKWNYVVGWDTVVEILKHKHGFTGKSIQGNPSSDSISNIVVSTYKDESSSSTKSESSSDYKNSGSDVTSSGKKGGGSLPMWGLIVIIISSVGIVVLASVIGFFVYRHFAKKNILGPKQNQNVDDVL